jgi:hypothetical protein
MRKNYRPTDTGDGGPPLINRHDRRPGAIYVSNSAPFPRNLFRMPRMAMLTAPQPDKHISIAAGRAESVCPIPKV